MLALTGGKGGCGKSTTALGLAQACARMGVDPLVVDADVDCPDIHLLAGVEREPTWDAVANGNAPEQVCQRAHSVGGVAVVPAGSRERLAPALSRLTAWPGPVVVDCAAGVGPDATTPLRCAERSVLAAVDEPESFEDAVTAADVATRMEAPPVATVVRSESPDPSSPVETPIVERVPPVDIHHRDGRAIETVVSHPGVGVAHQRVAECLFTDEQPGHRRRMSGKESDGLGRQNPPQ